MKPVLKLVLGPTAVGKTEYAIKLARQYGCPVVNCDSRQIFKEMEIGVARPSQEQLSSVKHYFIASRSITEPYTAGQYELDALALLRKLFEANDVVVACGGSGLYIDALCNGLDDFPPADEELRASLNRRAEREGTDSLRKELKLLDPESYAKLDLANTQRIIRALEVTIATGRKFSSFKTSPAKHRPFDIEKTGLTRPREELYARIDVRVDQMIDDGLVHEVEGLVRYRHLPALNTVGYREIFGMLDGEYDLEEAVRLIKRNTRHYAKKQLTYWGRDHSINWIDAREI